MATKVIASQPPEWGPTGTATARAKRKILPMILEFLVGRNVAFCLFKSYMTTFAAIIKRDCSGMNTIIMDGFLVTFTACVLWIFWVVHPVFIGDIMGSILDTLQFLLYMAVIQGVGSF